MKSDHREQTFSIFSLISIRARCLLHLLLLNVFFDFRTSERLNGEYLSSTANVLSGTDLCLHGLRRYFHGGLHLRSDCVDCVWYINPRELDSDEFRLFYRDSKQRTRGKWNELLLVCELHRRKQYEVDLRSWSDLHPQRHRPVELRLQRDSVLRSE